MTIEIDLRNLTQEKLDEALPNMGACRYSAPCIIGVLMPPDARNSLDGHSDNSPENVGALVKRSVICFAQDAQVRVADRLQQAFDMGDLHRLSTVLSAINRAYGLDLRLNVDLRSRLPNEGE